MIGNLILLRISYIFVKAAYWLLPILKYTALFLFWGLIVVILGLLLFVIY